MNNVQKNTLYQYRIKLPLLLQLSNNFSLLSGSKGQIPAIQTNFNTLILVLSRLKNEKSIIKSHSQFSAGNFSDQRET